MTDDFDLNALDHDKAGAMPGGEKMIELGAENHPLFCAGPIDIPPRAAPATVARIIVAALFPDGLPAVLQGTDLSIDPSSWRGAGQGSIQFVRNDISFVSCGGWWNNEIPAPVYTALYGWLATLIPAEYANRSGSFHIPTDALADAGLVTLSAEALESYHAMLASAVERHPNADLIMLDRFEDNTPRSLKGFEYGKNRYNIATPGLQRWFRDNRDWFDSTFSFQLALTPPGGRQKAPRFGRKTKPSAYKDAATLRAEDGVERVYPEALVPIVVSSDLFYEPQRFMATRAEVAAIFRELSLLDRNRRPSVDLVDLSDWHAEKKIYGRQTYVRGKDFAMTPLMIEEVTLDGEIGETSPWYGATLETILANAEIERIARSDWSRTIRSGGHLLIDSTTGASIAVVNASRSGCVADIQPIDRPWISYRYGFDTLLEAKEACVRGLVSAGNGNWFRVDNFSEHFVERGKANS